MYRARGKFRPPLWATLALLLACAAFIRAGLWQLERGDEKRQLFTAFEAGGEVLQIDALAEDLDLARLRFRTMRADGRYDTEHQFLLDNMLNDGRPGYQVLTPLVREGTAVLINRGWVPANPDRSILPDIRVSADARTLTGRLAPLPEPGFRLGTDMPASTAPWPRRQSFPTVEMLRAQLGEDVPDLQLLLSPDAEDGYVRNWRPDVMSPDKHLSYAVQWFGFAVALTLIYLVVNFKTRPKDQST